MRVSLPLMLIASLLVHAGVAAGIALTYFHGTAMPVPASSDAKTSSLLLLRSEETSGFPQPASAHSTARALTKTESAPLPLPAPTMTEKRDPADASMPALALEANPNA